MFFLEPSKCIQQIQPDFGYDFRRECLIKPDQELEKRLASVWWAQAWRSFPKRNEQSARSLTHSLTYLLTNENVHDVSRKYITELDERANCM